MGLHTHFARQCNVSNGVFTLSDTENDLSSDTDEMDKNSQWHH